jgi:hypothetical protein
MGQGPLVSWGDDALWLGPLIVAHLKAAVPELRGCYEIDEVDATAKEPPQVPAALVMLNDLRPPGSDGQQNVATAEQDWLVMLCVRSARRNNDRANEKLGPLISKTVRAMQGWVPPGHKRGFAWRRGARPDYGAATNFFPLVFTVQVVAR